MNWPVKPLQLFKNYSICTIWGGQVDAPYCPPCQPNCTLNCTSSMVDCLNFKNKYWNLSNLSFLLNPISWVSLRVFQFRSCVLGCGLLSRYDSVPFFFIQFPLCSCNLLIFGDFINFLFMLVLCPCMNFVFFFFNNIICWLMSMVRLGENWNWFRSVLLALVLSLSLSRSYLMCCGFGRYYSPSIKPILNISFFN